MSFGTQVAPVRRPVEVPSQKRTFMERALKAGLLGTDHGQVSRRGC